MRYRLYRGRGEPVGLLQDPHYVAEIWSGSQFENDPSFTVVNFRGTGNCALADHDLFEVAWQPKLYPIRAVDVRERLSANMQLDLFISMVLHLHTWDEEHLARDHVE